MKTITYNNKQYKLPFEVELPEDPTAEVEIANRFSGEKTTMPEFAAAVYDAIIGSEMFGDYDTVRKGLDWFKQHFAAPVSYTHSPSPRDRTRSRMPSSA